MIKNKNNENLGNVCRHSKIMLLVVALANILIFWILNNKINEISKVKVNTGTVMEEAKDLVEKTSDKATTASKDVIKNMASDVKDKAVKAADEVVDSAKDTAKDMAKDAAKEVIK